MNSIYPVVSSETQALTKDTDTGRDLSFRSSDSSATGGSPSSSTKMRDKNKRVIINMGNGRTKQGHRCTVQCLNRYPIHHAARMGRYKDLKNLLDQYRPGGVPVPAEDEDENSSVDPNKPPPPPRLCCPLEKDECLGRTPLHYAACTGNPQKGLLCTRLLLESKAVTVNSSQRSEKLRKFVNCTDYNNETALHLAAKNEATLIVKELLLNMADLDITSVDGKCGLQEVYKRTPGAMGDALNQSICYVEFCRRDMEDEEKEESSRKTSKESSDEIDFTENYISVCLNFYPLLGSKISVGKGKRGAPIPETDFLYKINRNRMESQVRRQILNNVLVQAFLYFKWNKIKWFCFFAIFLHVIWLSLYIGIVIDVFVVNCPYVINEQNGTHGEGHNGALSDDSNGEGPAGCQITRVGQIASAILLLFSVGVACKEFFQFLRLGTLYIRFENLGQCILLSFIFLTTPQLYLNQVSVIDPLYYQLSAFGIFLAWTLFLCQLAKLPRFCMKFCLLGWNVHVVLPDHGLYVEILSRVFKNFIVFITIFSSLLISFVFSFNILLPNSTGFINLSNSFLKVLTMMTGELNYDDIFHSDEEELIYPISSHVMYAIFIMVATIILFNLLIGFTVSDIQGLQKDAEVNQISNKLEQIFLMECFLLSTPMQLMMRIFSKIFLRSAPPSFGRSTSNNDLLRKIMVTRTTSRQTWLCYHTKIKNLPHQHRVEIRDWASKNCMSISDISGVMRSNLFQNSFTRHNHNYAE